MSARTRNYASILYLESCNKDWLRILEETHVPCFVSPLHDLDSLPDSSCLKKPHYHILLMFDSVKTPTQARTIFDSISSVGCEPVNSLISYSRYLCHLDSPDKHLYSSNDVLSLNGADYLSIINKSSNNYNTLKEILDFCEDNNVFSFYYLSLYSFEKKPDWVPLITSRYTLFIKEFLKSKSWTNR